MAGRGDWSTDRGKWGPTISGLRSTQGQGPWDRGRKRTKYWVALNVGGGRGGLLSAGALCGLDSPTAGASTESQNHTERSGAVGNHAMGGTPSCETNHTALLGSLIGFHGGICGRQDPENLTSKSLQICPQYNFPLRTLKSPPNMKPPSSGAKPEAPEGPKTDQRPC